MKLYFLNLILNSLLFVVYKIPSVLSAYKLVIKLIVLTHYIDVCNICVSSIFFTTADHRL